MADKIERQDRDEATETRDQLLEEASEITPPTNEQNEQGATPDALTSDGHESAAVQSTIRAPKPRRAARKNAASKSSHAAKPAAVDPEATHAAEDAERAVAVVELESQGFSETEALRLIDISKRQERSTEAREARRLRFTRWLVEQGILDEFSA